MLRRWFADSETILWARLQVFLGAVWTVVSVTDLTPIFAMAGLAKYLPLWLIFSGIVTEVARRAREPEM